MTTLSHFPSARAAALALAAVLVLFAATPLLALAARILA